MKNKIINRTRRQMMLQSGAVVGAALMRPCHPTSAQAQQPDENPSTLGTPWMRRSLKDGMIGIKGIGRNEGWQAKFELIKRIGFEGVEPMTGSHFSARDMRDAAEKTGVVIEGTHGGYHWKTRHTDPNPQVRDHAQAMLEHSLRQTSELGADTFLTVPGVGSDGTAKEVKQRAFDALSAAIPTAKKLGVRILIENVQNEFLYDPNGGDDQSVQPLVDFVDSFGSEWIGVQFDLGNHWKYGDMAAWIKALGSRIKKLDIKGYSKSQDKITGITEGDIQWQPIRQALAEIGYQGWLSAELSGGDATYLRGVREQMDVAMQCDKTLGEVQGAS